MRALLSLFLVFLTALPIWAAESERLDTGKVVAQLLSSHNQVMPGETFHVALLTELDDHWHTYWQNPGDSGEPVQITWQLPNEFSAGEIIWPLPAKIPTGPIINYGFEGAPLFPVEFQVSENAKPGDVLTVTADVYYLVCKDLCIPEDGILSLDITVGDSDIDYVSSASIETAINDAPKPGEIKGGVQSVGNSVFYSFTDLPQGADLASAEFFPFDQTVIDHSAPPQVGVGETGVSIGAPASYGWDKGQAPNNVDGVLRYNVNGQATGEIISVSAGTAMDIGAVKAMPQATSGTSEVGSTPSQNAPDTAGKMSLLTVAGLALFGGFILNLMPCVFPVISLKALSIAGMGQGSTAAIRKEAWAYTAGVLATFIGLVAFLLVLKAGGEQVGWGFQLQSPKMVGGLALLLFIIGLNLLGMFEIGGAVQGVGQGLTQKNGAMGSFFTGVLAVIVATPCTAPFMATAVGYGLAQPAHVSFIVFAVMAIGFASPFLLLAYVPKLASDLPKPGAWMVRFKELLAFPMFAASIWLVWVLVQQAGERGLVLILSAMLSAALGFWLAKGKHKVSKILAALVLLSAMITPFTLHAKAVDLGDVKADAWSHDKVKALRAEGRPVFVDFTAAWCVTCKVNERTVIKTDAVQAVLVKHNTAFLIADWTNKNETIARELEKYGRSGVPLYLMYPPGHNDVSPVILPQILSKSVIEETLEGFN